MERAAAGLRRRRRMSGHGAAAYDLTVENEMQRLRSIPCTFSMAGPRGSKCHNGSVNARSDQEKQPRLQEATCPLTQGGAHLITHTKRRTVHQLFKNSWLIIAKLLTTTTDSSLHSERSCYRTLNLLVPMKPFTPGVMPLSLGGCRNKEEESLPSLDTFSGRAEDARGGEATSFARAFSGDEARSRI
jgi:hypothetical protein